MLLDDGGKQKYNCFVLDKCVFQDNLTIASDCATG